MFRIRGINDGADYVVKSVEDNVAARFKEGDSTLKDLMNRFVSTPKECYQLGECCFMLRPYSEGIPLRLLCDEFRRSNQEAASKLRQLAAQLVSGIEYLHSRDLLCV